VGRARDERHDQLHPEVAIVPLYLTEAEVETLLDAGAALEAVEGSFRHVAAGAVENRPRFRLGLEGGRLAVMAAVDLELGYAGVKAYGAFAAGACFCVLLFDAHEPVLRAVIEADALGRLRTGAASGVAARWLARQDARTLGVIGCGWQARGQVEAIRAALPSLERVVVYCRTPERLAEFCAQMGADPAESHREAGEQDVVVTITGSRDPVLRGEWLRPGALVCAAGANNGVSRELDNVVLERAVFVCCDSLEQARHESADLWEPVESGALDWLEVHELHEVVGGEVRGRQEDADIVVFKSNGIAAWDVAVAAAVYERARAEGKGREL
jgi:ornithine cyclodeaminase/alanine dehydrogenase-like protein (mu-crystallin family)